MKFNDLDKTAQVVIAIGTIIGMVYITSQLVSAVVTTPAANAEDIHKVETKIEAIEERYNKHVESAYKDFLTRQDQAQAQPPKQVQQPNRKPRKRLSPSTTLPYRRHRKER